MQVFLLLTISHSVIHWLKLNIEAMKDHTEITRVQFCQKCYDKNLPQIGIPFVTIGRSKRGYIIRKAKRKGTRGFTPHIIQMMKVEKGMIQYNSYCSVAGCGLNLKPMKTEGDFNIEIINDVTKLMPRADWNALVQFKDDPQYTLD